MTVLALVQDPRNLGGVGTVEGSYRAWMDRHRPGEWVERYLDDSDRRVVFSLGSGGYNADNPSVPAMLPQLHLPPYIAGRRYLRDQVALADEIHVIGGVAVHGYLARGHPGRLAWIGTTIGDERRAVTPFRDWKRRGLHRVTLPFLEKIENESLFNARRILAQSPHTADVIASMGVPSNRLEVVPVPIDISLFQPHEGEREGVLFVGRAHDPRKGFPLLVDAFGSSDALGHHVLHVVSSGPPLEVPTRVPRLKWWGAVDDVSLRYRSSVVLAVPSLQEGLGIVVFEAFASGTPVVVTHCGGPEAWVTESGGGLIVDDARGMAEGLLRILSDRSLAQEMGARGREWVSEHASFESFLANEDIFTID